MTVMIVIGVAVLSIVLGAPMVAATAPNRELVGFSLGLRPHKPEKGTRSTSSFASTEFSGLTRRFGLGVLQGLCRGSVHFRHCLMALTASDRDLEWSWWGR